MRQYDRVYKLTLGNTESGQGVEITNLHPDGSVNREGLQFRFDISKSSDNKKSGNSATVEIYNLSIATLNLIETEYLTCRLEVGYKEAGTSVVLDGNVVETSTRKSGNDYVTQLILGEGYTALTETKLKGTVSPGKTVKDVIEEIRLQMPGVDRGAYTGLNCNNPIMYGYQLRGLAKDALNSVCEANNIEWNISGNVLNVTDVNGPTTKSVQMAPLVSKETGLIDIPFYASASGTSQKKDKRRRRGVQFKCLLNPELTPGVIVRVESERLSGTFRINNVRISGGYRDNEWYTECWCADLNQEDIDQ